MVTRVALDAMGGDHAPAAVVDGLALSIERNILTPEQAILTGPRERLAALLRERRLPADGVAIQDAPDVLEDGDSPVDAMRRKPRNSIAVGIELVRSGAAAAFLSAGNTGTVVATAKLGLRGLEGIRRPAIAVTIEAESGPFIIVDVGANPQPKAVDLLQYALMGSAYHHDAFGTAQPRVALMNIGAEDSKGNPLAKEAGQLLREAPINFVGNIEGVEMFRGACDVIVCDGFTGNVLLKASEGVAEYMLHAFARVMDEHGVDADKRRAIVGRLQRSVDYSEYGGALLLGVEGLVTICHGRSGAAAICNAVRFALKAVGANLNQHIVAAARSAAAPP